MSRNSKNAGRWRRIQQNDSSEDESGDDESITNTKAAKPSNKGDNVFKQPNLPSTSRGGYQGKTNSENHLSASKSQKTSSQTQLSGKSSNKKEIAAKRQHTKQTIRNDSDEDDSWTDTHSLTLDVMVRRVAVYILVGQGKLPVRRSDIIKLSMNKQRKDFPAVITKVSKDIRRNFGVRLIGIKESAGAFPVVCDIKEASSFFTVSFYRHQKISIVVPNQSLPTDVIKAALLLILTVTYMTDKEMGEDAIWNMLTTMDFTDHLCGRREDFKKFLKTEYVDTLYLTKRDIKNDNDEYGGSNLYGWGVRADEEVCKYTILKFVCQCIPNSKPEDFVTQFSKIAPEEVTKVREEDEILKSSKNKNRSSECELDDEIDNI